MKKIGIMSMQRITNYGSFLQAYALKRMIQELGMDTEFVDYHAEPSLLNDISTKRTSRLICKLKKGREVFRYHTSFKYKIAYIYHKRYFAAKYFPLLGITKVMNYNPQLDCLLIGSDEVFNCIQLNPNVGYSLELFGKNNRANKVITYAASFGNTTNAKIKHYNKTNEIAGLLKRMNSISVRDSNSGDIVKTLTGIIPEYHLDPVLVYDYMKKCEEIPAFTSKEKFLILYAYSGRISDDEADWISMYANRKSLKVYTIGGIQKCADRFIDCSPFEVLAYFKNAEEVVTDTFHGSIFSIITHKKFSTLVRRSEGLSYGNEEKLIDLLKRLGLEDRMITSIQNVDKVNSAEINYDKVDDILWEQRVRAYEYLKSQLK